MTEDEKKKRLEAMKVAMDASKPGEDSFREYASASRNGFLEAIRGLYAELDADAKSLGLPPCQTGSDVYLPDATKEGERFLAPGSLTLQGTKGRKLVIEPGGLDASGRGFLRVRVAHAQGTDLVNDPKRGLTYRGGRLVHAVELLELVAAP